MDQRRSERVLTQLPVIVVGNLAGETPFTEATRAAVVNAHGALVTLTMMVRLAEKVKLRNPGTGEEQDCRVVYLGEKQAGRVEVGLRFKEAAPKFWGLEKLPKNWQPSVL